MESVDVFNWGDNIGFHDPLDVLNSRFTDVFSRFIPVTMLRVRFNDKS